MANALYGRYEANKPLVYSRGSEAMVFAPAQFWPTYWLAKERFPLELAFRIVRDVTGKEARAILTKFGLFKTDWQVKNFTGADCIKVLRLRIQHEKVKVYKISSDEMFSVYSGDSYLSMNCKSALTLQDPNQQGVKAFREKLAIELSTLLMHRRSDKIRKDDAYWSEGVVTRFLIVTGSVIYVFGESIAALVKLAFNVIYSIAKAIHYTVQQALKTLGDLATGDFEAVQRDIQRLVGGVVQGIETMAASLVRGYDIVKTIWGDDHSKKLLLAFIKEYVDGTSVVDAATFGIMLTIDVILIIGTLGAGAVVVGARLAQRVGQFTVRALQFIVELYRALKVSRAIRRATDVSKLPKTTPKPRVIKHKSGGSDKPPEKPPKTKTKGVPEEQLSDIGRYKPVPLSNSELANVGKWSANRNQYLKKWRDLDTSSMPIETQKLLWGSADRSIRKNMTPDDMAAVLKERRGVVILKEDGVTPYKHLQDEWPQAKQSILKTIGTERKPGVYSGIKGRLRELEEMGVTGTKEVKLLKEKLSDLSNILDSYENLQIIK